MLPRTICTRGHRLEAKQVTGGVLGVRTKHCSQCRRQLNKDDWRYSCKSCGFHLCGSCVETASCQRGHPLQTKVVTGSLMSSLGLSADKQCGFSKCRAPLRPGATRHSCKTCDFHVCDSCMGSMRSARAMALAGHCMPCAPPSGPTAPPPPSAPPPPAGLPVASGGAPKLGPRLRACRYGTQCYQKNAEHLAKFAHPGDRNYRHGIVVFETNAAPEFESLWQLFKYHDPDESGFLSKVEFEAAMESCNLLAAEDTKVTGSADEHWARIVAGTQEYVNFRQFVTWAKEFVPPDFPLGLEVSASCSRPCRFRHCSRGGERCSCPGFQPADETGLLCVCGHKASMHRSDAAEASFETFREMNRASRSMEWTDDSGLVRIEDEQLLLKLQEALDKTHKPKDNWTRDRGCRLHGINGCGAVCANKNQALVPTGYKLLVAYRNQNEDLWQKYSMLKTAISEECSMSAVKEPKQVATSGLSFGADMDAANNEWYLFHGTTPAKCASICSTNFRTDLAGAGATWKDKGKAVGTPLYGFGIYFAERITKADEYATAVDDDDGIVPEDAEGEFFTVLLCRVVGGRTNVVTTNEIEREKLRSDVFDGPYHSVFGDRVSVLNKPYREIVVYEKDQCFPEYLLVYSRVCGGSDSACLER